MLTLYKWIVAVAYLVTLVIYWRYFVTQESQIRKFLPVTLAVTVLLHLGYLAVFSHTAKHLPLSNVFEVMTTIVFLYSLTYLVLELFIRDYSMGIIILSLSFVFQTTSNALIDTGKKLAPVLMEVTFFQVHVSLMMLAYSGFTISFIASLLYVLLSREIHDKQLGFFFSRLPSLELLDRMSNLAVAFGVIFLSLGMLLGGYMANKVWGEGWPTDPKLVSVFVTWIIYASFLYLRNQRGWQGKKACYVSIAGFGWLLISFGIFTTFLSRLHSFT